MDANDEEVLKEMQEREQMKHDGIDAYIQGVSEEFLRNDSWESFEPLEIAEASLEAAVKNTNSAGEDDQTHRFRQFLSIATNFSSLPFAEKLHRIPELVDSIKQLLENMMKEVQEYSYMANELRDLIQCFVRMVMQAKHNINMMLPKLTAAKTQMTIVHEVMSIDPTQTLNQIDKKDIELALNRMSTGIKNLLNLAKVSTAESRKLDERIHNMTNSVQSKKVIVEERLEIAQFCFKYSIPVSALTTGAGVGGLVLAEAFGGTGALVIAGTAFPPIAAIIGACIIGGVAAGSVILLVKKFWERHQLKALNYLEKIFESLVQLNSANMHFMRYMADTEEKANAVSEHIQDIQLCLESERQRRTNRDVCIVAIDSTIAMIESLQRISNLDISEWTDTSNIISFSKTKATPNAIKN
ncbi:unnamed protein product [Rotaria magnacalcarata]|uniref:Uncharacterized protein n=4 Tax=Rotaria magnacalcarata TaxID=392030 RepID=A0A819E3E5_9BILA|nr:unnamed protein product [Rotaria magnacalcarata]CAF3843845.1 unnamed protein product [Rotaria magnacalcarata]